MDEIREPLTLEQTLWANTVINQEIYLKGCCIWISLWIGNIHRKRNQNGNKLKRTKN
jgi:hypothetical protein